MYIDKIISVFSKRLHGCPSLACIVRIQSAVGAFHDDIIHPGSHGNPFKKIHCGDHCTFFVEFLFKRIQGRLCACSPEPRRVGRILSFFPAFSVHRVVLQDVIASHHHVTEHFILRQILSDPFCQDIVRCCQLDHVPLLLDQKMAVAGACVESISIPFQPFTQRGQKFCCFLRADLTGTVIQYMTFFILLLFLRKGDKIAAERYVVRCHLCANAQRFQRRSSRVIFLRIISDHGKVCRITSRSHPLRYSPDHADLGFFRETIHIRRAGRLQRCPASQFLQGLIRHTVTQNNNIFHLFCLSNLQQSSHSWLDCQLLSQSSARIILMMPPNASAFFRYSPSVIDSVR